MEQFDLLSKTELSIHGISLQKANLNEIAATVADILRMDRKDVLVTDVRNDTITIDILKKHVDAYHLVAKKDKLLRRLSKLPGVGITKKTSISSEGRLGWIALDKRKARAALERSVRTAEEIGQRLSKRAIVFSTGFEVAGDEIKDTNTPMIAQRLEVEGYSVTHGPTLSDDELLIAAKLREAVYDDGYGLVITTGGVGAEYKDHTIEAVLAVDTEAATPYICRYKKGTGRHSKDGVKIAVGQVSQALIIALPGPNDEVKSCLDVLVRCLKSDLTKHVLAEEIASTLAEALRERMRYPREGPPEGDKRPAGISEP